MISRAIHIFPEFENIDIINDIRKKYDPLYKYIKPHITIIFPFNSILTSDQIEIELTKLLMDFNPFTLEMDRITGHVDGYVFLNISKGMEKIIAIHDKLYSGKFSSFYDNRYTYIPHITLGRIGNREIFLEFLRENIKSKYKFRCLVKKISVEIIHEDESSEIEYEYYLPLDW